MPQIIAAIIGIVIAAWVFAVIVWAIQWTAAIFFWIWQVMLLPFFIYFFPAMIMMIAVISVYKGSWVAIKNYYFSLKLNVNSDNFLGHFIKNYIIGMLTLFLLTVYFAFTVWSFSMIYTPVELFVSHVKDYFEAIVFPAFQIHFPFWD